MARGELSFGARREQSRKNGPAPLHQPPEWAGPSLSNLERLYHSYNIGLGALADSELAYPLIFPSTVTVLHTHTRRTPFRIP